MKEPLVEIHNLHKSFGDAEILKGINLTINEGEVVALLGASGSGKSTLLRCINVLEKPDQGFIRVGAEIMGYRRTGNRLRELRGRRLSRQRAQIGMVFQHFNLYENMTARENVGIALNLVRKLPKQDALVEADRFLDRVGLLSLKNSYPSRLSGGQQQRVGIARVLAMQPSLVLLDEPTSALDPELVGEVLTVIKEIVDLGVTMMIVTHEVAFARSVSDRAIFMGDGEIIESGMSDKVLGSPEHERTRSFLKSVL